MEVEVERLLRDGRLGLYNVIWVEVGGKVLSYRFHRDELQGKLEDLVASGAKLLRDPFRKGAPLGGHNNAPRLPKGHHYGIQETGLSQEAMQWLKP